MHKIFFDTETTGISHERGHRLLEIGAVEHDEKGVFTGRQFHHLINPERDVPDEVVRIHGHTYAKLKHCPKWADINDEFCEFVRGASLYAHNADFDSGFIIMEMKRCESKEKLFDIIHDITNTVSTFRAMDPGHKSYNMDNMMDRYGIDRSSRTYHGALLDSQLLAELYYKVLREGKVQIHDYTTLTERAPIARIPADPNRPLIVTPVDERLMAAHREYLANMLKETKHDPIGLAALTELATLAAPPAAPAARAFRP